MKIWDRQADADDRQMQRQKTDGQVDPVTIKSNITPFLSVWWGSKTRNALSGLPFIFSVVLPVVHCVCFLLCSYFNLSSFFAFIFLLFFPLSGFPSLLCACDVRRRLRALCQRCLMTTKLCKFPCLCVCVRVGLCRLTCLGRTAAAHTFLWHYIMWWLRHRPCASLPLLLYNLLLWSSKFNAFIKGCW